MAEKDATLEWFGLTTFRLKVKGLTLFLDAWLDGPSVLTTFLKIDDVTECDYIFISHAHFDHLPGADRLAKRTGATVVANGEAVNVMRAAGVLEAQLVAVAGGERIPLFTKQQKKAAATGPTQTPGPPTPPSELAPVTVHTWPSLHALMPPGDHRQFPEFIDSGTEYVGGATSDACTLDVTRGLTYDLGKLLNMDQFPPQMPDDAKALFTYMKDREKNRYSFFDGGQIMFNFLLGAKTLLWSGHMGAYEGIMKDLQPKPDVAILAIAGRANLNGRPFDGSAADFVVDEVKWLGEPDSYLVSS